METLVKKLNEASDAYYNGKQETMSDKQFDSMIDELRELEDILGYALDESPTHTVGSPISSKVDKLQKVTHQFPAKSLDKTKDVNKFISTFNVRPETNECNNAVIMWKLDGSTVQLTYHAGKLVCAATRGDGQIGQDITHNAKYITGIPLEVEDKSDFTVRGEAVMTYSDFNRINEVLPDEQKYKNPRNLASATITMLDPEEVKPRNIQFYAFELVDHPNLDEFAFYSRLMYCEDLGFQVVEYYLCNPNCKVGTIPQISDIIDALTQAVNNYDIPVDGLVAAYDDTSYTRDLKGTEHHPHILKGYALKWSDETVKTTLRDIEWSPSRTGLLNPVAVFDPVELEGTTVSRASLHNFSIMRNMHIRIGDDLEVYKANKIIPQVDKNLSDSAPYSDENPFGDIYCPECNMVANIHISKDGIESVYCDNPQCKAKLVYRLEHYCSREAMNIEGLSESTIKKFVDLGYLTCFADIYKLDAYSEAIKHIDGFGVKSWENLWSAIQKSRTTTFIRAIVAFGIPNIGISQAKSLSKYFDGNLSRFMASDTFDFSLVEGIGQVAAENIHNWIIDDNLFGEAFEASLFYHIESKEDANKFDKLSGLSFVITGKVNKFSNRKEFENVVELNGGKVTSSVTSKTSYLVNNDLTSTSSKNKKANELNIPIISEEQFLEMLV